MGIMSKNLSSEKVKKIRRKRSRFTKKDLGPCGGVASRNG
jgi:hypothetical protein